MATSYPSRAAHVRSVSSWDFQLPGGSSPGRDALHPLGAFDVRPYKPIRFIDRPPVERVGIGWALLSQPLRVPYVESIPEDRPANELRLVLLQSGAIETVLELVPL